MLTKTAVAIEIAMAMAVLSCFLELTGWTKSVDKMTGKS